LETFGASGNLEEPAGIWHSFKIAKNAEQHNSLGRLTKGDSWEGKNRERRKSEGVNSEGGGKKGWNYK